MPIHLVQRLEDRWFPYGGQFLQNILDRQGVVQYVPEQTFARESRIWDTLCMRVRILVRTPSRHNLGIYATSPLGRADFDFVD